MTTVYVVVLKKMKNINLVFCGTSTRIVLDLSLTFSTETEKKQISSCVEAPKKFQKFTRHQTR